MIQEREPTTIWREVTKAFLCTLVTVAATKAVEHLYEAWKKSREKDDK